MTTYALTLSDTLLSDGVGAVAWLHDLPKNPDNWRVEALVASDDFCEMLAVCLEQIATALPVNSVEQYQIQDAIGHLLYVQRHYKLVKRNGPLHTAHSQRANDKN
jgi:hypothetical protein